MSNLINLWRKAAFYLILAALAGFGAVMFWRGGEGQVPPQTQSLMNLHTLCTACRKYAIDHNAMFPPTLDALFPAYATDRKLLVSPYKPDEPNGYKYTTGLKPPVWPNTILIEDKFAPPNHRIVAYADGSARIMDAQQATGAPSP